MIRLLGAAQSSLAEGSHENLVGSRPLSAHTFTRTTLVSVVNTFRITGFP